MNTAAREPHFESLRVSPETLWEIWSNLKIVEKRADGRVTYEILPRYLDRPVTQILRVRLQNGWVIGIAHRRRSTVREEWTRPDPKRIFFEGFSLYC